MTGRDGEPVGFAFHKVAALLAFLVAQADRPVERDRAAGLLWPEAPIEAARRNFRQALFELRQTLASVSKEQPIEADRHRVRLRTGSLAPNIDLVALRHALDKASTRGVGDPSDLEGLRRANALYRGRFLAGFSLDGCAEFDAWIEDVRAEVEGEVLRLRKILLDAYRLFGRYEEAVSVAEQIVELTPLSETAHRELMELLVLSGDRSQALAQFDSMTELFDRELGTSPTRPTLAFRAHILERDSGAVLARDDATHEHPNPHLPLVGRQEALTRLAHTLRRAATGEPRPVIVTGASGSGKSRLVRTFLDDASSRRGNPILVASAHPSEPRKPGGFVGEALRSAGHEPEEADETLGIPRLLDAVETIRRASSRRATPIFFVDDVHWLDDEDLDLFLRLWNRPQGHPSFVVGSLDPSSLSDDHPLAGMLREEWVDRIDLSPLTEPQTVELASALVEAEEAAALGERLFAESGGLPFHITNLVNALCDEGILRAAREREWTIDLEAADTEFDWSRSPDEIVLSRVDRLPTSARRLLGIAAIIGHRFDLGLLERLADEDPQVVEICVGQMLRRWILRRAPTVWSATPQRRDTVLWASGARLGTFGFAHEQIWRAVYDHLPRSRRRALHEEIVHAVPSLDLPSSLEDAMVEHHLRRFRRT